MDKNENKKLFVEKHLLEKHLPNLADLPSEELTGGAGRDARLIMGRFRTKEEQDKRREEVLKKKI